MAIHCIKCLVLLGLAVTVLAPAQSKPAPPTDRLPDAYQIYSLIMPGQVFTDMDSGQPWAIANTTVSEDDMNPKLAPEATLQPPARQSARLPRSGGRLQPAQEGTPSIDPPVQALPALRVVAA